MSRLAADLRFATRALLRQRSFTLVAFLTLSLGIGAATATFSMVHSVLLRALPFPDADRLVIVASTALTRDDYAEWMPVLPVSSMEIYTLDRAVLTGTGPALEVRSMPVSRGFLKLLGARVGQGRSFDDADYGRAAAPAAIISHHLWTTTLAADPAALGRGLTLDGVSWNVVGILDEGFDPIRYRDIDLWIPITQARGAHATAVAHLADGATLAGARRQAGVLADRLEPDPRGRKATINVQRLTDVYSAEYRSPLLIAFAAALAVLLIACANTASLLFARGTERVSELAVRTALGAGRLELLRQLLIECSVLASASAAGGTLLAWWVVDALPRFAPVYAGRLDEVRLDPVVLGFAIGIAGFTTLVAGLAPAVTASRAGARAAAAGIPRSTPDRSVRRLREAFITAEIALALMLLIGCTLLVRTFLTLNPVAPGFAIEDRVVASIRLPARFDEPGTTELVRRLTARIREMPSRPRVAAVTDLPLTGLTMIVPVDGVDGRPAPPIGGRPADVHFRSATPEYFDVLGLRLARGRSLRDSDAAGSLPVAVINRAAARRLWPDEPDPIGRTITMEPAGRSIEFTIVGICEDARIFGNTTAPRAELFASFWQVPFNRFQIAIHDPTRTVDDLSLRNALASIDADLPISSVSTLRSIASDSVSLPRFQMLLMLAAAGLALLLALTGCYSVLAYNVAQRHREFGVRCALGAAPGAIVRLVARRGAALIAAGILLGMAGAWAGTRVLASLLFGISPTDPLTFGMASLAVGLAALLAALIPARRAAAVQPIVALRAD
jgi:putative ABC transport system permease protein